MSLDDRLRSGLARSVALQRLDEDDALAGVLAVHRRRAIRGRVVQQVTVAVVLVVLFAGMGAFVIWQHAPARYRTTAVVHFDAASPVDGLALARSTQGKALVAADLAPDDERVTFDAAALSPTEIALTTKAPSAGEADGVVRQWVAAIAKMQIAEEKRRAKAAQAENMRKFRLLRERLLFVDRELFRLDPAHFGDPARFPPRGAPRGGGTIQGQYVVPSLRDSASQYEVNLAFERPKLLREITLLANQKISVVTRAPGVVTKNATYAPAKRVDERSLANSYAFAGITGVLVSILLAGFVIYRRRVART